MISLFAFAVNFAGFSPPCRIPGIPLMHGSTLVGRVHLINPHSFIVCNDDDKLHYVVHNDSVVSFCSWAHDTKHSDKVSILKQLFRWYAVISDAPLSSSMTNADDTRVWLDATFESSTW